MSINIWNLEWLNHNSQRSYPLTDWSTKECTQSAAIKLPDDFILALSLAVNSCHTLNIDSFYIKSVLVMESGCTVVLGYEDQDVAVTHVLANSDQVTYSLTGLGDFDDIVGYIAINSKSNIMKGVAGYYTFTKEATQLEPDCIRPMIRSISSVSLYTEDAANRHTLYGDIIFRAGANMNIGLEGNQITFNAIDSCGLTDGCLCDADDNKLNVITTINGVGPDENGNIQLTGSNCLHIEPNKSASRIMLEDTCSEPCCGCVELDALHENLQDFINGASSLERAVEDLASKQAQLAMVYNNEGKVSCNCKASGESDETEEAENIIYCYRLCPTVTMQDIRTFEFAKNGADPKYEVDQTIAVKGDLNDADVWWNGTVSEVFIYRTFKYWERNENPELFRRSYMDFGLEWAKHNLIEEYRAYFIPRQFNTLNDGPENIPDRPNQVRLTTWGPESLRQNKHTANDQDKL